MARTVTLKIDAKQSYKHIKRQRRSPNPSKTLHPITITRTTRSKINLMYIATFTKSMTPFIASSHIVISSPSSHLEEHMSKEWIANNCASIHMSHTSTLISNYNYSTLQV